MNLPGKTGRLSTDLEDWAGSTYRLSRNDLLTDAESEMINAAADILKRVSNMVFDRAIRQHNSGLDELKRAVPIFPE